MSQSLYTQPLRLTDAQYRRMEDEMIGVCRACRHQQGPLEPDAHSYKCGACGFEAVDGIETLLECGHVEIV